MSQRQLVPFRFWLHRTFIGPLAIGVLFCASLNGLVVVAREPIIVALTLLINQLIRQSHPDTIPLSIPYFKVWFFTTFEAGAAAVCLLLLAPLLALWMFPKSEIADH